jgi:hypothetical protein
MVDVANVALFDCCHAEKTEVAQKSAPESQADAVDPKDVSNLQSGDNFESSATLYEDAETVTELSGADEFVVVNKAVYSSV